MRVPFGGMTNCVRGIVYEKKQVASGSDYERLICVRKNRGHKFASFEEVTVNRHRQRQSVDPISSRSLVSRGD